MQAVADDGAVVSGGGAAVPGFTSEGDDFGDAEREGQFLALWQHGAFAREAEGAVGGKGFVVVGDLSVLRAVVAAKEFDEGGFARAVRADDGGVAATGDGEVELIDEGFAAALQGEAAGFEVRGHSVFPRRCQTRVARKGAPMAAVRMPMGSSAGAMMVRAMRSASESSAAPKRSETVSYTHPMLPTIMPVFIIVVAVLRKRL